MTIGDDDRRQKSQRHREAAYHRWQSRGERATRRTSERAMDGLDWVFRGVWRLLGLPGRGLSMLVGGLRSVGGGKGYWRR